MAVQALGIYLTLSDVEATVEVRVVHDLLG
jgi:hypothetical protein